MPKCEHGLTSKECYVCASPKYAAQAEKQEPVAWMWNDGTITSDPDRADGTWSPLYTAPRQWVGLTDEEIKEIKFSSDTEVEYVMYDEGEYGIEIDIFPENFARAIEAKLKEKNA